MTKKDYVLIASAMRRAIAFSDTLPVDIAKPFHDGMTAMARTVAGALQTDNARFDFRRFLEAADVDTFEARTTRTQS